MTTAQRYGAKAGYSAPQDSARSPTSAALRTPVSGKGGWSSPQMVLSSPQISPSSKGGWSSPQKPASPRFVGNLASSPQQGVGGNSSKGNKIGKGAGRGVPKPAPPPVRCTFGPDDPPPYGDLRYSSVYWDARHAAAGDVPFDWYMSYDRFAGILRQRLPAAASRSDVEILDIGFGTSELPSCLHADGWTAVTGIDNSQVAVSRAQNARRHQGRPELDFRQMSACKMDFPADTFDAVIDKALLDTLACSGHAFPRIRELLSEVYRVLSPGGVYFCVSHAAPATRLPYLTHDPAKPWRIEVSRIAKSRSGREEDGDNGDNAVPDDLGGGYFHIYICTKPRATSSLAFGPTMIFQLGTNNWQRPMKDGSGTLEFAPGSGVLHEAHHNAYNRLENIKCFSMYPSKNQAQPTDSEADYRVFELSHDIPICESASPNSSKRWHSMSEGEFSAYVERLEKEVYDYTRECETRSGQNFTMFIAHHSFVNPLVLRNVIKRREAEGLPKCKLYCFVHGTALKMYRWELGGKDPSEFPMRFHKMISEEKLFNDIDNGVNACFVISQEQKEGIAEIFPSFPQDRVIVAPNGINFETFRPRKKDLATVMIEQTRSIVWPSVPTETDCKKYDSLIVFVGKYAEWKRQAALLHAAASYEKDFPNLATFCAGTGPDEEKDKLVKLCEKLGLRNTFILGARAQDVLAELYTVASLGCFPSFKEPFGLVFVECMACKTPVIGVNSGGPKDFVSEEVGELVPEPPETTDLATVPMGVETLGKTLKEAICRALKENWKRSKGEACLALAREKFSVETQVVNMLSAAAQLDDDQR